ncbi:unnamed protein product [Closterium sp. Naga37s-1]|nr:unnamed protein product [Closterium sp. Naga37s-1]
MPRTVILRLDLFASERAIFREALAVKDAAKKFPDFNIIDSQIRKTAENIGRSSISRDAFMELQDVVLKTQLEVQGIFNVRWLSCGDAVARFSEVLPILFWVWHKEDQAAYKIGTSFKFQFMLFFLADVLEMLNTLNMAFQKLVVDIDEVKLLVDKLKLKLAQRYVEKRADYGTAKSKHLHAFLEKHGSPDKHEITIHGLDKQENACTVKDVLHEHPIGEGMGTNLELCIKLGQQFAQELIAKLDYRLGDLKHFDGEKLFMPNHYPLRLADREAWLNAHLYKLLDMFKEKLPSITYKACQLELELFAATMFKKFKDMTFQQALTNVLRTSDWRDDYPTLVHLWCGLAVLPLSTVECERGFSRQNIIKSWDRTTLSDVELDQLMTVKMLDYPVEWVELHKIFSAARARKLAKRA